MWNHRNLLPRLFAGHGWVGQCSLPRSLKVSVLLPNIFSGVSFFKATCCVSGLFAGAQLEKVLFCMDFTVQFTWLLDSFSSLVEGTLPKENTAFLFPPTTFLCLGIHLQPTMRQLLLSLWPCSHDFPLHQMTIVIISSPSGICKTLCARWCG